MTRQSIAISIRILLYVTVIGLVFGIARWPGEQGPNEHVANGQTVPPTPTATPTATSPATVSPTPSSTPTKTPSPTPTQTATPRATSTPLPTPLPSPAQGNGFPVPGRGNEPLILRGEQLERFLGKPIEQLGAYIVVDGQNDWRPVLFQVDEVDAAGDYVAVDDGVLGPQDEVIVMLRDLGKRAADPSLISSQIPGILDWYEIRAFDPLAETNPTVWLYVVRVNHSQAASSTDYLDFNHGFHRITSDIYTLGLGATNAGADYLRLTNGPEIFDRIKMNIDCATPIVCPETEDGRPALADGLVKDGPVRLILRHGDLLAYDTMLQWTTSFTSTQGPVRFSFDFNRFIGGARYYNANEQRGVLIDGRPDLVRRTPFSPWWQVSTDYGTLVFVSDLTNEAGGWRNYYKDNNDYDAVDTGDRQHFGDTGIMNEADVLDYTYAFTLYFVPSEERNIGPLFADLPTTPISVATEYYQYGPSAKGFLPLIRH